MATEDGYVRLTPVRNDAQIDAEIDYKTAILLLLKGRKLPGYLASMDLRSRIVAVTAIDGVTPTPMPDLLFECLVVYPVMLADSIQEGSEEAEEIAHKLDELADVARERMAGWSFDDLRMTYLDAGHRIADAVARRTLN